ncbi:morphogenetic protein associated with SpoVID [Natribacillus halophilus]|uniref:Morphogenetic protein associated with SpoVID n=1 Tax=Natribacillus halophilus TaxID=549003 RepID=A0A1G8NY33_9BACI|nr:SafA/ExsA family spore coat assembly protein [Natribacillus halophilus]SDI85005.1 morphogenetic protein associated with SpoVID [Natribacillus halophilus]
MKIHIVQKGDTLWNLAKQYDVDFEELKAANTQLADPEKIMPGMKIKIPGQTVPAKKEAEEAKKKEPVEKPPVKDMPEMPKKPEPPKKEAEPKKPEPPKKEAPIMKPPPKKMPVMEAPKKDKPEPSEVKKEMPQKPPPKPDKDKMKLPPKIQKPYLPKEEEKKEKQPYKQPAMEKPKTNMQPCKTCGQPTDMPSAHQVHYGPPQQPMYCYMMPVQHPYHGGYQQQPYQEGYDQYYHGQGYGGDYRATGGEEPGYGFTAYGIPPYVPVYDPALMYGYLPVAPYYEQQPHEQTYYPYAGANHSDE